VERLKALFGTSQPLIGVVHLLPLPSSARWGGSLDVVIDRAEQEATALAAGGMDALIVENYHDAPFTKGAVDPAVVSTMTLIIKRISHLVTLPLGVNVLRNDAHSALAIAACTSAQFIRVNVLTGAMVTDQGIIEGDACSLMRYRRELGIDVRVFADVLVKHAVPMGHADLLQTAQDTVQRGLADALILSGPATGSPPNFQELAHVKEALPEVPLLIGSGANIQNIRQLLSVADGAIVASSLKRSGQMQQPADPIRTRQFVEEAQGIRKDEDEDEAVTVPELVPPRP